MIDVSHHNANSIEMYFYSHSNSYKNHQYKILDDMTSVLLGLCDNSYWLDVSGKGIIAK